MKRLVVLAVVVAAALAVALVVRPDPQPRLTAVEKFTPGTCRAAAEPVRSLARLTYRAGVAGLTTADRAGLHRAQDQLVAVRAGAAADVRAPIDAVVLAIGYLRLRLDSHTAEPSYLRDVEMARAALEKQCVPGLR